MDKYNGATTLENMSQARSYNKWVFDKLKKHLRGVILEVGCGIGSFTNVLCNYGEVFAIDIDRSLIERVETKENIKTGFGDIEKGEYFFKDKRFDTVVCINVLEHIREDSKALRNMYDCLESGGKLILLVPIYEILYGEIDKEIGHFRRYSPAVIKKQLQEMGFRIIFKRKLNLLGAIGWFIAGKVLKNKQVEEDKIKIFNLISPFFLLLENIVEPIIGTSVLIIAQKK